MKASARDLGGCLSLVEPFKMDGSKRVRLMTSLGPVALFIVFVISLYLCRYPFFPYSIRTLWLIIEDTTIIVYYCLKVDFI